MDPVGGSGRYPRAARGGRTEFPAPFSRLLWITSGVASAILILVAGAGVIALPSTAPGPARALLTGLPVLIMAGTLPFAVRRYRILPGVIEIQRLGWITRLDLAGFKSADVDRTAMRQSIRLAGNGGLYSFTGWFWNQRLGKFRALVSDPDRTVVLRFDDRTVVISPDSPEEFVRTLKGFTEP